MAKANWENLIESYNKLPDPVNRVFLIPLPFADVDSACSTYTEVAEWNEAWGVNVQAYSEPDKHRKRYTFDVSDDEPQCDSSLVFLNHTKSVGEIIVRRVSESLTELSVKATGHDDRLVTLVVTTFLKNWLDERHQIQYWTKTEDEPAIPPPQPTGINISNITSVGDVNINLSNVAGRDQTDTYTPSTPTNLTYQELFQDGLKFLKSSSYDKAIVKLRKAIELEDAETKAYYYLAVALLKGRSFNSSSLHPKTRNEIEKHLKHSRIDNPNWLPPIILLAIMEIEYHSLHGTPNKNVVIDDVAKMVKQQGLSPEESQLLSSCSLKERTKRRLHLSF